MNRGVFFKLGRILFLIGVILFLFVLLLDTLVYQSFEALHTKIIAIVATTLLVLFADAGRGDRRA